MTTPSRIRKSIDSLTGAELADYEHAFAKLKQISEADPSDIDGLQYFQDLHNTMLGPCEHANDTFMPWHRAHLFEFEEALRRSDPPRTANVTQPYWDWSALPSGSRYPKAFENPDSVLHHAFRRDRPICRAAGEGQCDALPFPRRFLEQSAFTQTVWSAADAGDSAFSFGGHAGGQMDCQGQFGAGFGALENPPHNTMHDGYVGGTMADPGASAEDPVFFSFHCYIDLLWAQWQKDNETNTDLNARLCGLFKDREHNTRYVVSDTRDTETMGYVYEYTPGPVAPVPREARAEAPFPAHPARDVVASARNRPALVRTLELTVPKPGVDVAKLHLGDVKVTTPFSYSADIYLTPAGVELRTENHEFRARYLADVRYIWKSHHAHGDHTHNMTVDLGRIVRALANRHAGESWVVSVALTASDGGQLGHGGGHGHGEHEPAGADHGIERAAPAWVAAAAPAAVADPAAMDFGELALELG